MSLNMDRPIWVWCYITSEARNGRGDMPPLSAWPQAHTYAFTSEAEALAHPEKVFWKKHHGYVLQKVYLQGGEP